MIRMVTWCLATRKSHMKASDSVFLLLYMHAWKNSSVSTSSICYKATRSIIYISTNNFSMVYICKALMSTVDVKLSWYSNVSHVSKKATKGFKPFMPSHVATPAMLYQNKSSSGYLWSLFIWIMGRNTVWSSQNSKEFQIIQTRGAC